MQSHHLQYLDRLVGRMAAGLMLGVAGLAFGVSFEAIRTFAARSGAVSPGLAWAIPPLVDATIVMASLVLFNRTLVGEPARFAIGALIISAAGSLSLNIAHAPHRLGSWAVALIAPAALVLSVELAMSELRRAIRHAAAAGDQEGKLSADATAEHDQLATGGAPAAPLGVTLMPLLVALQAATDPDGIGTLSGNSLSRAFAEQGIELSARDARRLLSVLRPQEREEALAEQVRKGTPEQSNGAHLPEAGALVMRQPTTADLASE